MLPDKKTEQLVKNAKLISEAELKKFTIASHQKNIPLEKLLFSEKVINEDILYNALAVHDKLPFINLREVTIPKEVLFVIPEPIATTYQMVAFKQTPTECHIALTDPDDIQTLEFIKRKVNRTLKLHITTPSAINEAVKQYHKNLETELSAIQSKTGGKLSATIGNGKEGKPQANLEDLAKDMPVIRVVDTLLEYAIFEGASDIHIEPTETAVIIRYRIDGILRDVMTLPKELQDGLTARIKILSNLKLDEHRLPQDGRFKVENKEFRISFRVSLIPIYNGEKIVLRLLDESRKTLTLEELGLQKEALKNIQDNLKKPQGMILVTGPTGSGKTTTLYTMIDILNSPKVNISTVEDPIEYRMERINQSQVNPKIGFTFANGLRSLLRQDPDIIMVGEIRDKETANIAVNAAMTGHLVLSTLHTNDAPTTLPRLSDMGIEAFLVSTTVNVVLAQRLVRKICQHCIASYNLTEKEVGDFEKHFRINIDAITRMLLEEGALSKKNKDFSSILFFRGKGCNKCGGQGYKGRIGIYEVLTITDDIKELITTHAPSGQIMKKARESGMLIMLEDGFLKAKAGVTTIEEVLRVTSE